MNLPRSIARLADAINSHDPDRVAGAFTDDYRCEMPMHPSRGFTGNEQVRTTWTAILGRTPDLDARVTRWIGQEGVIWSEWEMQGTSTDGSPALMRGVVISTAQGDGPIEHTRFYLDPVVDQ